MPLIVTIPPADDCEGFSVAIDNSGLVEFLDYDFDPEVEEAAMALGMPMTCQYLLWDEISRSDEALVTLLFSETFLEPLLRAFEEEGACAYGTPDAPFDQKLWEETLLEALTEAIWLENRVTVRTIAEELKELGRQIRIGDQPLTYEDPRWPAADTVCVKRTLYISGSEILTWVACGERYIDDPVSFDFTKTKDRFLTNAISIFGYHHEPDSIDDILHIFDMHHLSRTPEVPKWDVPDPDKSGRWGVAYVNESGYRFYNRSTGDHSYRPTVEFVTYGSLDDAEMAAEISSAVISHGLNLDDYHLFIMQYDGTFGCNPMEDALPELWDRFPSFRREAQVLIPWHVVEKVAPE